MGGIPDKVFQIMYSYHVISILYNFQIPLPKRLNYSILNKYLKVFYSS